jgi:hypothetical protein
MMGAVYPFKVFHLSHWALPALSIRGTVEPAAVAKGQSTLSVALLCFLCSVYVMPALFPKTNQQLPATHQAPQQLFSGSSLAGPEVHQPQVLPKVLKGFRACTTKASNPFNSMYDVYNAKVGCHWWLQWLYHPYHHFPTQDSHCTKPIFGVTRLTGAFHRARGSFGHALLGRLIVFLLRGQSHASKHQTHGQHGEKPTVAKAQKVARKATLP